jgi:hypothetical protein
MKKKYFLIPVLLFLISSCLSHRMKQSQITSQRITNNQDRTGPELKIHFQAGQFYNHPSFVIWTEDANRALLETLFITESTGKGEYAYGKAIKGKWEASEKRYPSSLPYWSHKRGQKANDGLYIPGKGNEVPDGITGATPQGSFTLNTRLQQSLNQKIFIMLEINQTWDFNEFWTNNRYPDNENYKRSCQPALVYQAVIDPSRSKYKDHFSPVGHSHYAGENGQLYKDLSTLTTALQIVDSLYVEVMDY